MNDKKYDPLEEIILMNQRIEMLVHMLQSEIDQTQRQRENVKFIEDWKRICSDRQI